jgi:hypothetical protein
MIPQVSLGYDPRFFFVMIPQPLKKSCWSDPLSPFFEGVIANLHEFPFGISPTDFPLGPFTGFSV